MLMGKYKTQTINNYPDRDEIKDFICPYGIGPLPMKTIDNEKLYKVEWFFPSPRIVALGMLLASSLIFLLSSPLQEKLVYLCLAFVAISINVVIYKKLAEKFEKDKIKFIYDKNSNILHLPIMNLDIPKDNILEFSAIYGWLTTTNKRPLICEVSVIFKNDGEITRAPLLMSRKSLCIKIAKSLAGYIGCEYNFMKV